MATMTDAERLAARYPGPYIVRGELPETHPDYAMGAIPLVPGEPCEDVESASWPYLIRQDREFATGETPFHLAIGIQDIALANLFAAAPDLRDAVKMLVQHAAFDEEGDLDRAEFETMIAGAIVALAKAEGEAR